jgi:hypothetical protein
MRSLRRDWQSGNQGTQNFAYAPCYGGNLPPKRETPPEGGAVAIIAEALQRCGYFGDGAAMSLISAIATTRNAGGSLEPPGDMSKAELPITSTSRQSRAGSLPCNCARGRDDPDSSAGRLLWPAGTKDRPGSGARSLPEQLRNENAASRRRSRAPFRHPQPAYAMEYGLVMS